VFGITSARAETGDLLWMLFKPSSGNVNHCEGSRCVQFEASSNPLGGGIDVISATANFRTSSIVSCTTTGTPQTWRSGTASNPNAGDFVYFCPLGEVGWATWYYVDPL
jgi:hypothetical protein